MAKVTSYSEIISELGKVRDKALKKTAVDVVKISKEIIDKVVYDAGSPENYQRTYQLRDSFRDNPMESKGDVATVKLDHNKGMISPSVAAFQHASSHWSPWDYSGHVAKTVHDGTSGGLFGDGYWRSKRAYIPEIEKDLNGGRYKQLMLAQIRSMGFNAK